jgi:hypothetical protein
MQVFPGRNFAAETETDLTLKLVNIEQLNEGKLIF